MSVSLNYLSRMSADIEQRVSQVIINGSEEAEIIEVSSEQNKATLKIGGIDHLNSITSITVHDDLGNVLSQKNTNILVSAMQLVELELTWEVVNK